MYERRERERELMESELVMSKTNVGGKEHSVHETRHIPNITGCHISSKLPRAK